MAVHSIELCAGVGMLGEGFRAACEFHGIEHRTVLYVEREAPAAAQIVCLMEAGALDPAPIWSDLRTFDGAAWRGCVDFVIAGFPCQDLSIAGRRAGLDGARSGLFFNVLDIADACGARGLVLENVSGIASATAAVVDEAEGELEERAAARVLGELADRGWDAEWITLSASDVGASHGRARWFCLAWRAVDTERAERGPQRVGGTGGQQGDNPGWRQEDGRAGVADKTLDDAQRIEQPGQRVHPGPGPGGPGAADAYGAGIAVADAERIGCERRGEPGDMACPGREDQGAGDQRQRGGDAIDDRRNTMAQPECAGCRGCGRTGCDSTGHQGRDASHSDKPMADAGEPGLAQRVGNPGVCGQPPEPSAWAEPILHGDALGIFAPGPADPRWPGIVANRPDLAPAVEPGVRMLADGMAHLVDESRAHQLRQVGNGVVAAQAGVAFAELLRRAGLT